MRDETHYFLDFRAHGFVAARFTGVWPEVRFRFLFEQGWYVYRSLVHLLEIDNFELDYHIFQSLGRYFFNLFAGQETDGEELFLRKLPYLHGIRQDDIERKFVEVEAGQDFLAMAVAINLEYERSALRAVLHRYFDGMDAHQNAGSIVIDH